MEYENIQQSDIQQNNMYTDVTTHEMCYFNREDVSFCQVLWRNTRCSTETLMTPCLIWKYETRM